MFGLLKKKLSKVVESISGKLKKKEEAVERVETIVEEVEQKSHEEILEQIEPVKEEIPEIIDEIKLGLTEIREKPEETKSIFKKIKEKIKKAVVEKKLTEKDLLPILDNLEVDLIEADVVVEVVVKIKQDLLRSLVGKEIKKGRDKEIVIESLKKSLLEILSVPKVDLEEVIVKAKSENRPACLLFFGVNGVGKSLNLSKVAYWLRNKGYKPILGAGDTYRAAGDIQLEQYAEKIKVPVIKHQRDSDSAAVIYDARKSAEAKGYEVVLGDTSGRMHVKKDLLDELAKIVRVNKPDLKVLVLDSLTGSDVVPQFEYFDKAVGVDAIFFSKNDVNEKGGNILSVCYLFKKPIIFLGTGQNFEDLLEYNPERFANSLLQ